MANDEDKKDDRAKNPQYDSWLVRQIERRNPENALIRRWFKLADQVIGHKDDSEDPEK